MIIDSKDFNYNMSLQIDVHMNGEFVEHYNAPSPASTTPSSGKSKKPPEMNEEVLTGSHSFRLEDLAYTRSGDKGNNVNVGEIHVSKYCTPAFLISVHYKNLTAR